MGLAEDIQRVRMKARGAEINARHRRGQEKARAMAAALKPPTPIDGVNPEFARALEGARARAKAAADQAQKPKAPQDRIQQLVLEGKLPPRADQGVGYEPTAEEVLGEFGEFEGETETLPDASAVLAGEPQEPWGQAPGTPLDLVQADPSRAPTVNGQPVQRVTAGVASAPPVVQSKRKRGK